MQAGAHVLSMIVTRLCSLAKSTTACRQKQSSSMVVCSVHADSWQPYRHAGERTKVELSS